MITTNEIKKIRTLASKKVRSELGLFIAEGDKLISELLPLMQVAEIYEVGANCTDAQMQRISQLKTPTTKLALFRIPTYDLKNSVRSDEKVLVLDSVQDPGNLGTILRTADWFGIKTVVCSPQTADVFSSKVVQATMGSIGRVRVLYTNLEEWLIERQKHFPNSIYGTFLERSTLLNDTKFDSYATIVMGNEGNGISAEVEKFISNRITIPRAKNGTGESLNVAIATSIILSRL